MSMRPLFFPPFGFQQPQVHDVCRRHKVLLIADEVQTGLCRAGTNLACDHDGVRPDILVSCLRLYDSPAPPSDKVV